MIIVFFLCSSARTKQWSEKFKVIDSITRREAHEARLASLETENYMEKEPQLDADDDEYAPLDVENEGTLKINSIIFYFHLLCYMVSDPCLALNSSSLINEINNNKIDQELVVSKKRKKKHKKIKASRQIFRTFDEVLKAEVNKNYKQNTARIRAYLSSIELKNKIDQIVFH